MKRILLAATPLTLLCAACGEPIKLNPPPPPADKLVCAELPSPPAVEPLEAFQASNGALVYPKADVDARDSEIARWVVELRGAWFSCSSQLGWVRDYYDAQN